MSIARDEESFSSTRWLYTSAVMAGRLEEAINKKCISPELLDYADIRSINLLFGNLLDAAKNSSIDEAIALNIGLFTATTARKGKSKIVKNNSIELAKSLEKLASFVSSLSNPRTLGKQDLQLATDLRELFLMVYEGGGSAAYERSLAGEFALS